MTTKPTRIAGSKAGKPPAYLFNSKRFSELLKSHKYTGIVQFCEANGISRRTLADIRGHRTEPSLTNVRLILAGFDGVQFETLFTANPNAAPAAVDEYADLRMPA